MRDGLPTGTAKERGFVFPVKDNFEGLTRIKECAGQLKMALGDYAIGTDNAFSEVQKGEEVTVTRRGKPIARIVPQRPPKAVRWPDSAARLKRLFPDGVPPGSAPSRLIHADREERF